MKVELELFTQNVQDFPSDVCFSDNDGGTDVFVSKADWAKLGFPHFITVNIEAGRSTSNANGTQKRSTVKRVTTPKTRRKYTRSSTAKLATGRKRARRSSARVNDLSLTLTS